MAKGLRLQMKWKKTRQELWTSLPLFCLPHSTKLWLRRAVYSQNVSSLIPGSELSGERSEIACPTCLGQSLAPPHVLRERYRRKSD